MRSLLMLIIGFILGVAATAYVSYDFLKNSGADMINSFVEDSIDKAYSGTNDLKGRAKELADKKSQEVMDILNQKKEEIKKDVKSSIKEYIDKKLENLF